MVRGAVWLVAAGLAACGSGGGGQPDAVGPSGCDEPNTVCPSEHPHPGGPCAGALQCEYDDTPDFDPWGYRCVDGAWAVDPPCFEGGCLAPPLAEYCSAPATAERPGAAVEIGPVSVVEPFRPFAPGERVALIWGPQGAPMIAFRVRLSGADDLACIGVGTVLSMGGMTAPAQSPPVTVRCGQTLAVFAVLPFDVACDERSFALDLEVTVPGLGTASASVVFEGGGGCTG